MKLPHAAEQLLNTFSAANSWEQKMRILMKAGDILEPITDADKITENLLHGCEAEVWLVAEPQNQQWHFKAYSEARLIRGLLAVLLARVNDQTSEAIQIIDLENWFEQLGLANQLSSSRRDGLRAMFRKVKSY